MSDKLAHVAAEYAALTFAEFAATESQPDDVRQAMVNGIALGAMFLLKRMGHSRTTALRYLTDSSEAVWNNDLMPTVPTQRSVN